MSTFKEREIRDQRERERNEKRRSRRKWRSDEERRKRRDVGGWEKHTLPFERPPVSLEINIIL